MSNRKKHSKSRKKHYQRRYNEQQRRTNQYAKNYFKQQAELIGGVINAIKATREFAESIKNTGFAAGIEFGAYSIDTETTGLDSSVDEILQVSIVNAGGVTIYNKYFKPRTHTEWKEAESVNHITPEMVKDCPTINKAADEISIILCNAKKIIGYNAPFDLAFLRAAGIQIPESAEIVDVMQMFAEIKGEPEKWHKLTECAEYYGYKWEGAAHDSAADAKATLYCYKQMTSQRPKGGDSDV